MKQKLTQRVIFVLILGMIFRDSCPSSVVSSGQSSYPYSFSNPSSSSSSFPGSSSSSLNPRPYSFSNKKMQSTPPPDQTSDTYVRVMKKMENYCSTPYNSETDDKTIDMYSQCFSNLIQANKDVVINCRKRIFRAGKQVKEADCSKEYLPQSAAVRMCITEQMKMIDPYFYFHDGDESNDQDISPPRDFLRCLEAGFT